MPAISLLLTSWWQQKSAVKPLVVVGFVGLLGGMELSTRLFPPVGGWGALVWLVGWLIPLALIIKPALALVRASYTQSKFSWWLLVGLWLILYAYQVVSPYTSGGESPQEIGCVLNHLAKPDAGYHQTCLFGYPARQYYLPALPSLWFGRSLATLNVGNSLYILLGLLISLTGIWHYWRHQATVWWGMTCWLWFLPQFYFFQHFFWFLFEQSIFPFAFALMGVGWWLLFLAKKDWSYLAMLGLLSYQTAFLYTPGLSLWVLGVVAITWAVFKHYRYHSTAPKTTMSIWLWIVLVSLLILGLVMSWQMRFDISITGSESTNLITILQTVTTAWTLLLAPDFQQAYFSPPMQLGFWLALGWLFYKRQWWSLGLVIWVAGVVILSVVAKGYAYYGIDFRLHRSMVAMPVVMIVLLSWLLNQRLSLWRWWRLTVVGVLLWGSGWQYASYLQHQAKIEPNYLLATQLQRQVPILTQEESQAILLLDEEPVYIPINDWLKYFSPRLRVSVQPPNPTCDIPAQYYQIVALAKTHECSNELARQGWQAISTHTTTTDSHVVLIHPSALELLSP